MKKPEKPNNSDKRRAAQMRASRIRSLRGIRASLIEDPTDQKLMAEIIDRQLASMGAETQAERWKRWTTEESLDKYVKTGKPYKITDADIKRYTSW